MKFSIALVAGAMLAGIAAGSEPAWASPGGASCTTTSSNPGIVYGLANPSGDPSGTLAAGISGITAQSQGFRYGTGASAASYAAAASFSPAGSACIPFDYSVTLNSDGSVSVNKIGPNNYDGSDDVLVEVLNISGLNIGAITGSGNNLFIFDNDGINRATGVLDAAPTNIAGELLGTGNPGNQYGGADAYFTGANAARNLGTVNFANPIQNGGTDYFSLEADATSTWTFCNIASNQCGSIVAGPSGAIPEPTSLALLGLGFAGLRAARRRGK